MNVAEGEYLLAVNGREVRGTNVYSFFEATADQSTLPRVGPDPSGAGSREVTVFRRVLEAIAVRGDAAEARLRPLL